MNRDGYRAFPVRRDPMSGAGPWIAVIAGLLLMLLASVAHGEDAVAKRTERFTATLSPRSTVRVDNVSGDVIATAGREFSAVCNTTVTAPSSSRADEVLAKTRTVQTRDGDELALESRWPDMEDDGRPNRSPHSTWSFRHRGSSRCSDCRINMRYEVVVPPGVTAILHTVNGEVRVSGLNGQLDLQSVNGNVVVQGSRKGVRAQTVNGRIEVAAEAAPAGASIELKTISGPVQLTLPKDARFDLSASTMTGTIESTFGLPKAPAPTAMVDAEPPKAPQAEPPRVRTPRRVIVQREEDGDPVLDVEELRREIEESMRGVESEVRDSVRRPEREARRVKFLIPGGEYHGSIGEGGAKVRVSNLNGRITILAAGSRDSDAKPLLERRRWAVAVAPRAPASPRTEVRVLAPDAPRMRHSDRGAPDSEEDVVRGDVAGDFVASSGGGTYRVGKVSGKVTILTHSGEIHVGSAGSVADLKSYGGDIQIGPVAGDLRAQTLAGDIRVGAVAGSAVAETSGGDIRIARVGGSADAKTAGGDIVLPGVVGGVHAETGGGEVRVVLISREARGGIAIRNAGGDVTLTVPSNFRGELDLTALDADADEKAIRSDFPEISVTRRAGSQQAAGTLNGGGPRVRVRTSSGSIRLGMGPPAGS
jgi:DUF4097 and DUF4098 domain-containing protein YvlB